MATKTQSKTQRNTQSKTQSKRNTDTTNENVDAAAERVRELNERIIESSKKAGNVYLDMYEKTLHSIADYQEKVGKQSDLDWVSTITNAQARFTRDVADAYTSSARTLLK
jgi:hypothetical protein